MYLFALILLSCLSIIEVFNPEIIRQRKVIFVFVLYSFFVFHDGFRWETGCDWDHYHFSYEFFFQEIQKENSLTRFEPGYLIFMGALRSLTDEFSVYLIVHALAFYAMIFYAVFKSSELPFTSLMMLYMVIVPYMGTNRQLLALAMFLIALYYLSREHKWIFVGIVVLSFFFHRSALICLVAIFLTKRINNWIVFSVLGVALVLNYSGLMDMLSPLVMLFVKDDVMSEKMEIYNELLDYNVTPLVTFISLCRKFIWLGVLLVFEHLVEKKDKFYYLCFNLYFIGIVMYVLLNGTAWQMFVARLSLYFNVAEIYLVVYVLSLFKPNYGKLIIMFLLTAYCWINIKKGFSNYGEKTDYFEPYKGLFINTDYARHNTD